MNWIDEWMRDPKFQREYARLQIKHQILIQCFGWLRGLGPLGRLAYTFWFAIFDDGLRQTLKPRWGVMTFAYLNDGMKPTLWHTWRQITHDQTDPYTGIWVGGAPHSLAEAEEWSHQGIDEWRHNHK